MVCLSDERMVEDRVWELCSTSSDTVEAYRRNLTHHANVKSFFFLTLKICRG